MSTSESPLPYVSTSHQQRGTVEDMDTSLQEPSWYGTNVPVNTSYEHMSFQNPYVTPSVSSAGFSPMPEQAKPINSSQLVTYPTTTANDPSNYQSSSEAFSVDYLKASSSMLSEFPKLSIPPYLGFPQHSIYNFAKSDGSNFYGFTSYEGLPPRPRSSPSVFSPITPGGSRAESHFATWPSNPLGISHSSMDESMFASHGQPAILTSSPPQSISATPEMIAPQPRRMYPPIAPHPLSLQRLASTKRSYDDEEIVEAPGKRRKTSTTSSGGMSQPMELTEEDKLLLKLKDEENLPWKEIAARFQTDLGKTYQVPALQMRLKRLRERLRVWTDADVKALRMAHEFWRDNKFEIIAAKMVEFGASDKWTSKQCARKWAEIEPNATPFITTQDENAPSYSYTASPVEGTSYMPYLHMP